MRIFTDQELGDALRKTSEKALDVLFAEATALTVERVGNKHSVPPEKHRVIADEVLYGLLGLTTTDERKSRIMEGLGIGEEKAEALIMDLKELFGDTLIQNDQGTKGAPVPQPPLQPQKTVNPGPLPTANTDLKERLHLRPETAKEQPAFSGAGVTKPLTREELMGSLSAKRTMASDIAAVKGAEGGGLKSATGVPPTGQPPEKK